jgi:hypothetical protein
MGVIVIIKNQKGDEVGRLELSPGDTAEVQETETKTANDPKVAGTNDTSERITTFKGSAFQQWMKDVQALPAEKQVEAVSNKLMELNPGFDGKITLPKGEGAPLIVNAVLRDMGFRTNNVTDISPIRALAGLKSLSCSGSHAGEGRLSDLSPLEGMKLGVLGFTNNPVSDISSLKGMPLERLYLNDTQVVDLSPLQDMKSLTVLECRVLMEVDLAPLRSLKLTRLHCNAPDVSPLRGMPLTCLWCINNRHISDISPLEECKSLIELRLSGLPKVTPAGVAALQKALPNCKIDWDDPSKPKTPEPAASGTK